MIDSPRVPAKRSPLRLEGSTRWILGVLSALGVLTFVLLSWFLRGGNDDPFITFRYADNLRDGVGFVYNAGDRTLSTTAPLYAVLLAVLGLLWRDLPAISNVVSLVAIVASGGLLVLWAQSQQQRGAAMVAAALLVLSPTLLMTTGAETALFVMLALAAFAAHARSHHLVAAGVLAFATMVRPDAVLAALALAIYHVARFRNVPWKAAALYVTLVAVWYAGLWAYFGSPIPVTLQAKQQQASMNISTAFAAGFVAWLQTSLGHPLDWVQWFVAIVGVGAVALHARHWLPLYLWTVLYFLAYTALGVSRYFWYYAVLVPAIVVLIAEGAGAMIRFIARLVVAPSSGTRRPAATGFAFGLSIMLLTTLLVPSILGVTRLAWQPDPRHELYSEIGRWLQVNTEPDATIGSLEVGILGYYSGRPIVDFAGLIQPDVAGQLSAEATYLDSARWAIQTYRPDYVLLQEGMAASLSAEDWFHGSHKFVRTFSNRAFHVLELHQRVTSQ